VFRLVRRLRFPLPSIRSCHLPIRSVLVVPPDFDGFLRSCTAGLSHPAADHGVRPVSDRSLPAPASSGGDSRRSSVPVCRGGWRQPPVSSCSKPKSLPVGAARSPGPPRGVFTLRRFSLVRSRVLWTASPWFCRFPSFYREGDSASSWRPPARSFSSFGRCLPPAHPVAVPLLPRLSPRLPLCIAALSGFRHLPRPQGFVPRSSPLQASSVSALACPILPWAWVPAAVPGLKGVLLISGRSHRGPTPGVPGALRSHRALFYPKTSQFWCSRLCLVRDCSLSFSALAGSGSALRGPPHASNPRGFAWMRSRRT